MKIINFISALLVITICFAMCFMVGCKSNNATSDDLSSVTSELTQTVSSNSTDETDVTTNTENTVESSENDVVDNNSSVVEDTPVVSTPSASTPVETPSEDVPSEDKTPSVDTSQPTDAIEPGPTYPVIKLDVPTTYYGYRGYFTIDGDLDKVHLVESGLGTDNSTAALASTEYVDIESNSIIVFVFEASITEYKDLMYNHVFVVGKGSTKVNVVY
ncbi:MAG: hypothetical protein IJN56_07970 [Clostridia bacterium]|nr:hypothetical protein [Clostridia bacterium]